MPGARSRTDAPGLTGFRAWRWAALFALPIIAFVIYLFYTWFGLLNRHLIFLYFHDMGAGFDTSPFGRVTEGRYWMSGLVASGAVMVLYQAINLILGRIVRGHQPPTWWRLWILCAIPLVVFVPVIVMTVNDPVLPFHHAAQVTGVFLIGLAAAIRLEDLAAAEPLRDVLLMVDGVGLAWMLIALRAAKSYPPALRRGDAAFVYRFLAVLAVSVALLVAMTAIYAWHHRAGVPGSASLLTAGLSVHYLFLPLYHYLCWCKDDGSWTDTDYFRYIPSPDNDFSSSVLLQLGVWAVVGLAVMGVTRLRRSIVERAGGARRT